MTFSSLLFLFRFLPLALLTYFVAPGRMKNTWKNLVLLLFSLIFYAWGEPVYIALMLFSTVVDYINGALAGRFIAKGSKKAARVFVACSIVINLALLGIFKYAGFFVEIWNKISGMSLDAAPLPLPIGISFYTFQTMSYTIDVYREKTKPELNIINFGTYVSLFPQLIAGPIVKFKDVASQLRYRKGSFEKLSYGVLRFCTGLAKKTLLANQAGEIFNAAASYSDESMTTLSAWLGLLAFSFQIYFDFSGYSDMAIGLMAMFGFEIPENFDYPYMSKSVTEFWRRWHISLGSWFKEYVYIPLGGSKKGRARTYLNIFAVWLLTGLWHGASLNFAAWGLYFCVLLIIEKAGLLKALEKLPVALRHVYALAAVYFGWLLFAWGDVPNHSLFIKAMLRMSDAGLANGQALYLLTSNILLLAAMAAGSTPLPKKAAMFICDKFKMAGEALKAAFVTATLVLSTSYLVNGSYNPFLYFRF